MNASNAKSFHRIGRAVGRDLKLIDSVTLSKLESINNIPNVNNGINH